MERIFDKIDKNSYGLVYSDPVGPITNGEKCIRKFDEYPNMDIIMHISENNSDRQYHFKRKAKNIINKSLNMLVFQTKRKNKYIIDKISDSKHNYVFYYATNEETEIKS